MRVSFGTTLIASIVIVYTAIIALVSSRRYLSHSFHILLSFFTPSVCLTVLHLGSSEDDNRGRRGGRSYDSGFSLYFSPTDLFWYVCFLRLVVVLYFKYHFSDGTDYRLKLQIDTIRDSCRYYK